MSSLFRKAKGMQAELLCFQKGIWLQMQMRHDMLFICLDIILVLVDRCSLSSLTSVKTLPWSLCIPKKWPHSTLCLFWTHWLNFFLSSFNIFYEIHPLFCFNFSKGFPFTSFSFQIWAALVGQKVIPLLTLNSCVQTEHAPQSQNGQAVTLAPFPPAQSWLDQSLSLKSLTFCWNPRYDR